MATIAYVDVDDAAESDAVEDGGGVSMVPTAPVEASDDMVVHNMGITVGVVVGENMGWRTGATVATCAGPIVKVGVIVGGAV